MIDLKTLQKLKLELFNSLIAEANQSLTKLPKEHRKKSESILKQYIDTKSIAGLELWVNGVSEHLYFSEAMKDLKEIGNDSTLLTEFQSAFTETLKADFGVEDFRFIEWERAKPTYPTLQGLLKTYCDQALTPCYTLNDNVFLGTESDLTTFEKADGPSKKGVKVKIVRKKTPKEKLIQIQEAQEFLEAFWPDGFALYKLLTDKLHIVQSNGLVSYSHFHEQGISYINFIDRDILESIDDLIHENAHHHLNLILKKYNLIKKEFKEDIFYSPWRKTLRPLYGIFHATFTFSYAALLFYHIAKSENWTYTDLDETYKQRAYFRFAEETLYVQYSLFDLHWAIDKGLFTAKGISLIESLEKYNQECLSFLPDVKKKIKSKDLKHELDQVQKVLRECRAKYKLA